VGSPPNQPLHLTGAAILVLRDTKVLQAAPAGELCRSTGALPRLTMSLFWLVLSVGLLLLGVALLVWVTRDFLRGRGAENWPRVDGVVTGTRIDKTQATRGGPMYHPVVLYRYELRGVAYQGDRLAFGFSVMKGSHSGAEEFLRAYPVGSPIAIRYDPASPDKSVILAGSSAGWWLWGFIGATFIIALGGVGIWSWAAPAG
jgi:hypothetical protein